MIDWTRIRAVLFDLDDTLLDHRGAADGGAWEWLSARQDWHLDRGATVELWRRVEATWFTRFERGEAGFLEQRRGRVRQVLSRDLTDDEADEQFTGYIDAYRARWRPFGDANAAVERCEAAGYEVAVLTNGGRDVQQAKLEAIGLSALRLFAVTDLGCAKPDPRMYTLACERLGVQPDQTLMIGDNPVNDVDAARVAGLQALLLDRTGQAAGSISSLDSVPSASSPLRQ